MDLTTTDSPRLSKGALFRRLAYEPHPGQLLVHRSKARFRVLACGTRWGKSSCAAMEAAAALLEPRERAIGWLVAPTYDLCTRIYAHMVQVVTERLGHRVIETSSREKKIVVTNLGGGRSELRCKSADHPVGLLGEALDFLIVDEAAQLQRETWEENLSARLIDRKGWALLISTPQGPGWFYEVFKRGRKNRDPECESWASPSRENPYVDPTVIEAERARLSPDRFAQQYEAEFLGIPREACEVCGGPRPDVPDMIELPDGQVSDDLPVCSACGMFVDSTGRCIVKYYNAWYSGLWVSMEWLDSAVMHAWHTFDANGQWE